jgi:hypothetical protein
MTVGRADERTCPSAQPEPGAILLGVVAGPSEVAYVVPEVTIDEQTLARLTSDGINVENRMRFAGKCIEAQCVQWSGERCGVIDRAVDGTRHVKISATIPACSIRRSCRWFAQRGRDACTVCPEIIRRPFESLSTKGDTP